MTLLAAMALASQMAVGVTILPQPMHVAGPVVTASEPHTVSLERHAGYELVTTRF